jgi:hypothetical protein
LSKFDSALAVEGDEPLGFVSRLCTTKSEFVYSISMHGSVSPQGQSTSSFFLKFSQLTLEYYLVLYPIVPQLRISGTAKTVVKQIQRWMLGEFRSVLTYMHAA